MKNRQVQQKPVNCKSRVIKEKKERSPASDLENLRRFVQYLPAAVAMVDKKMVYLACSARWCQQWELDSEIIGKSHYHIFPNLSASWQQKAQKCLAGEITEDSWSEEWVKWTIQPWLTTENTIGGLMLHSSAIAPPEPRNQLQLTQTAMDRAGLAVLWATPEGQICYANQKAGDSLGYSRKELLELNLDCIDENGWGDRAARIKQQNSLTLKTNYRTKDGSSFPVEVTLNYLEFNDNEYYCAFVRDICQEKKERLELIDAREQLQAVLDAVPGLVSWIDSDLRYLGVNRHLANAYGLPAENFIGKEVGFLQTSLKFNEFVYEFFASSESKAAKEVTAKVKGTSTTYLIGAQKYHRSGSSQTAAVFVGLDISDRKEMELALRRSTSELEQTLQKLNSTTTQLIQKHKVSSLGQLVASVAHEINNPINFISGNISHATNYTEDLLRLVELYHQYYPEPVEEIEEEMEEMGFEFLKKDLPNLLNSMTAGSERIREVVRSLRSFSRMDEAEMKAVDLHEGLDSTLLILQNRLQAKGGRGGISAVKEYGKLPKVDCYAGELNQAFMHLLTNAVDALEERYELSKKGDRVALDAIEPTIWIRTRVNNDNSIAISIIDNGPGMTEEVRRCIFDPLFSTKPPEKGTGLGLSISREIVVDKHRGKLYCQSQPGRGAEFVIEIPVEKVNR